MAQPLFTNNAATTLASSITNVATTLTVASGTGALFPSPTGSNYSYVTLINAAGTVLEIVKLTARSTDTLTITRAQEGTIASAFSTGDKVELRVTAAGMTDTFNNGGVQSATVVAGTGISVTSSTTTGAATATVNNTGVTSVTVAAGTGMSGGGTVTTTGTVTLTNAGVTSLTAGSGISLSGSTGNITVKTLPGSVIQVVTATQSTTTTTSSSSFVTTGLSATITPQSTTSKILVLHSAGCYVGSANGQAVVTAYRGSTNIGGVSGFVNVYSTASAILGNLGFSYLDSPATTSATTYTIYFANQNNSASCQYNAGATGTAIATITLLEISGS